MAKVHEFKDYSATVDDEDGDAHTSTVRAAVVTKDTAGEVRTLTGPVNAKPGDVLVETTRPENFDVLTKAQWADTGYGKAKAPAKTAAAKTAATAPAGK